MINDSLNCLDIIIFSETWNSTVFVPQEIKGFCNYKMENNLNQNDGDLIYKNNKLYYICCTITFIFGDWLLKNE